mmetsp:Transcript_37677/g.150250  ORF Transcript_37677/g.150250 Transcript_37677/m.150250 type:complete len:261 (+) Transcript_37677:682-1464(+)
MVRKVLLESFRCLSPPERRPGSRRLRNSRSFTLAEQFPLYCTHIHLVRRKFGVADNRISVRQLMKRRICSGSSTSSVRSGIADVLPGTVTYGGEASSNPEDVTAWSLITRESLYNKDTEGCVAVMTVPGSLSFMLSALLKNWAQPKFQEKLHFMIPKYVDDDKLDLLTAIRLDDWDKFTALIDSGLDINLKWEHKQNQTPLLAAAARVRLEMVKYLLERGAQVEVANDGGWTPLMYTESHDQEDARVKEQLGLLVEAGAK